MTFTEQDALRIAKKITPNLNMEGKFVLLKFDQLTRALNLAAAEALKDQVNPFMQKRDAENILKAAAQYRERSK
jgi:hypothetical protein